MKRFTLTAFLTLALLVRAGAAEPAATPDAQVAAVIKEIQTQHALIAENQKQIEAKLAVVAEAIRVARIYSSRSGH